jgi:hypothetical protein
MTRAGIRDQAKKTFREHITCVLAAHDVQVLFRTLFDKSLIIAEEYDKEHKDGECGAIIEAMRAIYEDWISFESTVVQHVGNSANAGDEFYTRYCVFMQDVDFDE